MFFKSLLAVTAWPVICFFAFAGNAELFGAPLLLISLASMPLTLYSKSCYITQLYTSILLLFSLSYVLFVAFNEKVSYSDLYAFWPLFAILIGICLRLLVSFYSYSLSSIDSLGRFKAAVYISVICIDLLLFLAWISGSVDISGRLTFLLGPNNLYRLVIANSVIGLIFSRSAAGKIIVALLSIILLILTGSKGAIISLIVLGSSFVLSRSTAIFCGLFKLKFRISNIFRIGIALAIFVPSAFYVWVHFNLVSSRALSFLFSSQLSSLTESSRFSIYNADLFSLLTSPIGLGPAWFDHELSDGFGFSYPHNIFFELVSYYGIFGTFISLFIVNDFLYSLRMLFWLQDFTCLGRSSGLNLDCLFDKIIAAAFASILLGSLFSGDLFDNVMCISFLIYNRFRAGFA